MNAPILVISEDPALRQIIDDAGVALQRPTVMVGADAIAGLPGTEPPACLVADTDSDLHDLDQSIRLARQRGFEGDIILVGNASATDMATRCIRISASDFIAKPVKSADLFRALRRADVRQRILENPAPYVAAELTDVYGLTQRESDVLTCVLSGHASKDIARSLNISPRTVEVYRGSMMKKLGARSVSELLPLTVKEVVRIVLKARI